MHSYGPWLDRPRHRLCDDRRHGLAIGSDRCFLLPCDPVRHATTSDPILMDRVHVGSDHRWIHSGSLTSFARNRNKAFTPKGVHHISCRSRRRSYLKVFTIGLLFAKEPSVPAQHDASSYAADR